jgi:hypothetical protein
MHTESYSDVAERVNDLGEGEDVSVLELHSFVAVLVSVLLRQNRAIALKRLYEYLDRYLGNTGVVNAYVDSLSHARLVSST